MRNKNEIRLPTITVQQRGPKYVLTIPGNLGKVDTLAMGLHIAAEAVQELAPKGIDCTLLEANFTPRAATVKLTLNYTFLPVHSAIIEDALRRAAQRQAVVKSFGLPLANSTHRVKVLAPVH